jgi:GTP 3',8-cyclase
MRTRLAVLSDRPEDPGRPPTNTLLSLQPTLDRIQLKLDAEKVEVSEAIRTKNLYFRVSVIGSCNLSCAFCHNEGGPDRGRLEPDTIEPALEAAASAGFRRLQFTGGEPLLHRRIGDFIRLGKRYFSDVGVTTNGTYLSVRADDLLSAEVTRVHVSLQRETLTQSALDWTVPPDLDVALHRLVDQGAIVRLNLPVAPEDVLLAGAFLSRADSRQRGFNLFTLLRDGKATSDTESEYLANLQNLAASENVARDAPSGSPRRVNVRDYYFPTGLRCSSCSARSRCTEQSRSLRLGVDMVLRPCLASREWDFPLVDSDRRAALRAAALLSVDW